MAINRDVQRKANHGFRDSVMDWLYGDYDEEKLNSFTALYSIPGVHEYFDYLLDLRGNQEYLNRYGMDYSDVHDPRKLSQTGSGSRVLNRSFSYVSRSVEDLYRPVRNNRKKRFKEF